MRLRVATVGVLGILFVVPAACDAGGPDEPEGARVQLILPSLDEFESTVPLRFAVAWTYRRERGFGLMTTDDVPLDRDATAVEVSISVPPSEWRSEVAPSERLFLGYVNSQPKSTAVYRPRFVVYEDRNENGRLDPDVLDRPGPDRVLGLEDEPASVAYLIDVESVFDEIPFSRIESFYVATEGRFTAFVTVVDSGNMLELSVWDPEVKIVLDDTEFPRYSLECMRPTVATRSSREVFVDDAVDLSICGIDQPRCRGVSLDEEPPPELPEPEDVDADFVAQCRRRGELEALVIGRRAITCESCSCLQAYEETVRIADLAALPDWWPCGDLLETCTDEDEDAFASYSATCAQAQREGELDSAEDE